MPRKRGAPRQHAGGGGDTDTVPVKLRVADKSRASTRGGKNKTLATSGGFQAADSPVITDCDVLTETTDAKVPGTDSDSKNSGRSKGQSLVPASERITAGSGKSDNINPLMHAATGTVSSTGGSRRTSDGDLNKDIRDKHPNADDTHGSKPSCAGPKPSALESDKDLSLRLGRAFYDVTCEDLAKALLGQKIVRVVDGVRVSSMIVETEAYLGAVDKAAHSYKRQTDRNKAMFMQPGTAYVYNIYGIYCCLNISSQGEGCAVLIRSVEPAEGTDKMLELRADKSSSKKQLKLQDLGNGPSKLCQSMAISKAEVNQKDLVTDPHTWLESGEGVAAGSRVVSSRINIAYAEEWTDKPLRFYILGNKCVSVRDKQAEAAMKEADTGAVKEAKKLAKTTETKSQYFTS